MRNFVRAQTTPAYRQARRADDDSTRVSQRVTLQVNTFAQVPLLNPDQLVTSWRELLPHLRDPEMRRLPLDLPGAGVYVVEAVHDRRRAYTVVVVSDVGVVAKASPGQMLLFAADCHSGDPRAECEARVLSRGATVATGRTSADGVLDVALPDEVAPTRSPRRPARRRPARRPARSPWCSAAITLALPTRANGCSSSRGASWPRSSTPTSRSTGPATPCT